MDILWIILILSACSKLVAGDPYRNIALNKTAKQSSTRNDNNHPGKAVDGNRTAVDPDGIIHTEENKTSAWWSVDLEAVVEEPVVILHFRTGYTYRRNGVQLYTSTTLFSTHPGGQSCYNVSGRLNGSDINSTLSVTCPGRWRHLMVFSETANDKFGVVLDFGEVEVLVCSTGYYGIDCNKSCKSRHCTEISISCYRYTGECIAGRCNPGWSGTDCTQQCPAGSYRTGCAGSCHSRQCLTPSDLCHHENGTCASGCKPGWTGDDCTQKCPAGYYSDGCTGSCSSRHCVIPSNSCHHVTGKCSSGCKPGSVGDDCMQNCTSGKYGSNCMKPCSDRNCMTDSDTCDHVTGNCSSGCRAGWVNEDCTKATPATPTDYVIPVVAGGGAGLLVIVIIIAVIVISKRRRKRRPDKSEEGHSNVRSNISSVDGPTERQGDNVYINVDPPLKSTRTDECTSVHGNLDVRRQSQKQSLVIEDPELEEEILDEDVLPSNRDYYNDSADVIREIPVGDLAATVEKIKSQECGFEAEYSRLPTGFTASYSDSQKPENAGKNKYKGYYPYDHNRIRLSLLPDVPGSDYINASLMHSYNQRKTYIGAQAPNKKTVGDFWRMIWEQRCGRVIMLTGLVEQLVAKCYQYWPDDGNTLETNQFLIEIKTTNTRANYTIRNMKSGESRPVVQYHFTSWPDHGVPDILALVHVIWMIRQTDTQTDGPMLVHCSAGIGRTGTYIAVDSLLDQARGEGMVNVLGYVSVMRGQRKNMIQTKEQYECVFHCLVEMTKFGNTSMDVENFTASYSSRGMDSIVDRMTLRELTQLSVSEKQNDNSDQNRIWVAGSQDFIARAGPTLTQRRGYLMTVVPPPGLEKLLWKLVEENNVHNVIVISQLQMDIVGQKGSTLQYNGMTIKTTGQTQLTPDLMQTTLQMKGSGNSQLVKVLKLEWSPTFAELSSFLVRHAHLHHVSSDMTPSVVVYSESDEKLAVLFCIMENILSGILQDGYVDVIGHVRSFLKCCQNLTITEEELAHLYDYASECIQMLDKAKTYEDV